MDSTGDIRRLSYNFYYDNLHNRVLNITLDNFPSEEIFYLIYRSTMRNPVSVTGTWNEVGKVYFSDHHLIIQTHVEKLLRLTMFDASGKVTFTKTEMIGSGTISIPVETVLTPGYYFLLCVDEDGNFYMEKLWVGY